MDSSSLLNFKTTHFESIGHISNIVNNMNPSINHPHQRRFRFTLQKSMSYFGGNRTSLVDIFDRIWESLTTHDDDNNGGSSSSMIDFEFVLHRDNFMEVLE